MYVDTRDAGQGFEVGAEPENGHLGIKGMRERAEVVGRDFKLISAPGTGTLIRVGLPLVIPGDEQV